MTFNRRAMITPSAFVPCHPLSHHHHYQLTQSSFTDSNIPSSPTSTVPKRRRFHSTTTTSNSNTTRAALSTDLFRAAAAAATLTFANVVYPTREAGHPVSAHFHEQTQLVRNSTVSASTTTATASPTLAVIGVSKSSIHDYKSSIQQTPPPPPPPPPLQQVASTTITSVALQANSSININNNNDRSVVTSVSNPRGEFMLATRLITAVMMGVMLGIERNATSINLGVRSITVTSLTSAIISLIATYSGISLPSTATTTASFAPYHSSSLAFVMSGNIAPAATALLLACLSSMLVFIIVRLKCNTRSKINKRSVPFAKSMSAVIGLCVGMGVACGAGLGLMTAGFYLGGVAVMRGDHKVNSLKTISSVSSSTSRRSTSTSSSSSSSPSSSSSSSSPSEHSSNKKLNQHLETSNENMNMNIDDQEQLYSRPSMDSVL